MAKKETKNKKVANKKNNKVSKVTEKQIEVIKETPVETKNDNFDFDKYKDEKGEYDLRNASENEIIEAFKNMSPEDEIFVTKKEPTVEPTAEDVEKAIEVLNEEPVVDFVEEAVEEVKKITKKVDRTFGYLWNGQAIDF
jgi:hypothetical protein